ncbi:tetratricopeptide repeat protein [Alkalicoccobacillus gibsonii]|uniref:tetratricopeptide repeat protein n=1 Tax=Alkalicoccobacillus gibsonii TaxID=79881 RepID=UPI001931C388|nr:hypothetical protein [Alkalicoccobacillus gibsonii]MBM0066781.1 hypothetical protein [Alkalicoccobacillus gibsonii]
MDSNFERAEFFHRMGVVYYRLNQYAVATSYIEQSKEIFKLGLDQTEKVLNCDLVIGCMYSELHNFKSADGVFLNAIEQSKDFLITRALLLRAYGWNLIRQEQLEEAERTMFEALSIKEHETSYVGAKTKSDLANILLRLGKTQQGKELLEEAETEIFSNKNVEYMARNLITRSLYIDFDISGVESAIQELIEKDYYFEVFEVSEEISKYFEHKENFEQSMKYLKLALRMHIKQSEMGD